MPTEWLRREQDVYFVCRRCVSLLIPPNSLNLPQPLPFSASCGRCGDEEILYRIEAADAH